MPSGGCPSAQCYTGGTSGRVAVCPFPARRSVAEARAVVPERAADPLYTLPDRNPCVMSQWIATFLIAAVGLGLAVQAAVNARLGAVLQVPIASALWNFLLGTVLLAVLTASGIFGRPTLDSVTSGPWWAYIGGVFGALFVTTAILAVPRVGTAVTFGAVICGQLVGAMLIDSFGWLGVEPIPLNPWRVCGVILLIAGVVLIQQK